MATMVSFDRDNFLGAMYAITPTEKPLSAMIGSLTGGGAPTGAKVFTWQTYDLASAAQPSHLENVAPTTDFRTRSEVSNVVQIYKYAVSVGYTAQAVNMQAGQGVTGGSPEASPIFGSDQPVNDELAFQLMLQTERAGLDFEYTCLQGAYANPSDNLSARQSRGLFTAITTNAVVAGGAAFNPGTHLDTLLRTMFNNGAPMRMPVLMCNSFQKVAISGAYAYAPEDRNVGGVNIQVIETDFARLGVVLNRHVPQANIGVFDLSVIRPRYLVRPNAQPFGVEPLAKTKDSDDYMMYGEFGLEYGPERWHGEITGLATS